MCYTLLSRGLSMANVFELSNSFLQSIEEYQDETTPLVKLLEESQNLLFQLYLSRRKSPKKGYFETDLAPFIRLRYYVGEGRFLLDDIDAYKKGFHQERKETPKDSEIQASVLDLLDDSYVFKHHDSLFDHLNSYTTLSDWFKRLLDQIPAQEREKITLSGVKFRKYEEIVASEKRKLEKEEKQTAKEIALVLPQKEERPLPQNKDNDNPQNKKNRPHKKQATTTKVLVKQATIQMRDDLEEKKLIASQNKALELTKRIKERIGIHFGWDEIFIRGSDGEEMLTLLDKKVRRKGLKEGDNDWIIVIGYTVEDEDFELIHSHYPNHTFRSDDILHKPSAEYVSLALVVNPTGKASGKNEPHTRRVESKTVGFENTMPEEKLTASEDYLFEEEEEPLDVGFSYEAPIKPVRYKRADTNHFEPSQGKESDSFSEPEEEIRGSFANPEEDFEEEDEEEIEVPKHWKCPFCPRKNPWHTEAPSRIIPRRDGTYLFLCAKHKNNDVD